MIDLDKDDIDEQFHYKIRFFNLTFESSKNKYKDISRKFMSHIFPKNDGLDKKKK